MLIPVSALLYKLQKKTDSFCLIQNIDCHLSFQGIKFYSRYDADVDERYLYLISEDEFVDSLENCRIQKGYYICHTNNSSATISNTEGINYIILRTSLAKEMLFNNIIDIFQEFSEWDQACHIAILENVSIQEYIDICEPLLEYPYILFGPGLNVMAYTRNLSTNYSGYNETIANHFSHPDTLKKLNGENVYQKLKKQDSPVIRKVSTDHEFYVINYKYTHDGTIIFLGGVFDYPAEDYTNYLSILDMINYNIFLHYQHQYNSSHSHEFCCNLFNAIFEEHDMSDKAIEETIIYYPELQLRGTHILGKLFLPDNAKMPLLHYGYMMKKNLSHYIFLYKNCLYLLKTYPEHNKNIGFFSSQEKIRLKYIFKNIDYHIGISDIFFHLNQIKYAKKECDITIEYIRAENQFPFEIPFQDIFLEYLLSCLDNSYQNFLSSSGSYQIIKNYDCSHPKDHLCELYICYLKNSNSISKTSAELFLHRNTITNKINKIFELTGQDPNNILFQIRFLLAYKNDRKS